MKNIIKFAGVVILLAMVNNTFGQTFRFVIWADSSFPTDEVPVIFHYEYTNGDDIVYYTSAPVSHYGESPKFLYGQSAGISGCLTVSITDNLHYWWISGDNPREYVFEGDEYIEDEFHWVNGIPEIPYVPSEED